MAESAPAMAAASPEGADGRRWIWTALVLAGCHAAALGAFQLLTVLVEQVKGDLAITDTQYSLTQGLAFALVASVLGLPAAMLADSGRRRSIVQAGAVIWSLGTLGCGLAGDFGQLFGARMMVGFGEVLLFPAALSIIAQSTPPARLARAIGLFACGGPIGTAIALAGGGWLGAQPWQWTPWPGADAVAPWRLAFFACAFAGLVIAGLTRTISPGAPARVRDPAAAAFGALRGVARQWRAYLGVSGGLILLTVAVFATAAWAPTVLVRERGLTYAEAGRVVGFAALAGGVAAAWACGLLVDRIAARGRRDSALIVARWLAIAIALSVAAAVFLPWDIAGIAMMAVAYALLPAPTVVAGAALQQMSPPGIQAQVMAMHLVLLNLLALSTGPTLVALISTHLLDGEASVAVAMAMVVAVVAFLAVGVLLAAGPRFLATRRSLDG